MLNTNLNFEKDDMQITSHVVPDTLPALLKECLSVAKTTETKDMLLLSILTTVSSVMDKVSFRYAHYGKRYYPNLLTFIMAGAASGKGVSELATELVQPIHEKQPLLIPGDSTYPAFYEQLLQQKGVGLLFETEGSVITDIWRSGCTNYNTALRKAAEHETLSKSRILIGRSEIRNTKLSALLTGTCGQFSTLVPSVENGFFSRLNMLVIRKQQAFDKTVFVPSDEGRRAKEIFHYWGARLKHWHDMQTQAIDFHLTNEQAQQVGSVMENEYGEYLRQLGDGFHASIVRNGITMMRVACILTMLRQVEAIAKGGLQEQSTMTCSDEDFETAMVISTKLLLHAADAYNQIGGKEQLAVPEVKGSYQKDTFLASLPQSFSTGECVKQGERMGVCERTIRRWIVDWCEKGILSKTAHGEFGKVIVSYPEIGLH